MAAAGKCSYRNCTQSDIGIREIETQSELRLRSRRDSQSFATLGVIGFRQEMARGLRFYGFPLFGNAC
jgi:hypothetical protein